MHTTTVTLEGAPNFRDLGGYRTDAGRVVASGKVFRSSHLAGLTDQDLATLSGLGIATVVDFRPAYEREVFGNDRLPPEVFHVSIPIGEAGMAPSVHAALREGDYSALPDLATANRAIVKDYAAQLGQMLRLLVEPGALPLVFHCIGGKDRTGVASALLLSILGVPWATAREDYVRSNDLLHGSLGQRITSLATATGGNPDGELNEADRLAVERFFVVDGAYLDAAHDEIIHLAGSIENYVHEWLGLSENDVVRLRELLLEDKPG